MGLVITLLVIGLLMLFVEMFLIPGFGIAGVCGILCFAGAIVMAFMHYGASVGFLVLFCALIICGLFLVFALRAKTWKRLSLQQNIDSKALQTPEERGIKPGMRGVSCGRLSPAGMARINNQDIEVYAAQGIIDPGTPVEVLHIEGMRIFVKEIINQ